jgi:ubiquitin C-terminal hydrolase
MQGLRAGQKRNEDLQSTQDPDPLPQEIQAKRLLLREDWSVDYFIFRLVDFPVEGLDLTDYLVNEELPEGYFKSETSMEIEGIRVLYDLIAISNHFGSTGGGHYTAYCK